MLRLATTLFVVAGMWQVTQARTWEVRPVQNAHPLRDAIAAAGAGDTVHVHAGTYREGVIHLDRPIVLSGIDRPLIDGEGAGDVIIVSASHVTIEGIEVRGTQVSNMNDNAGIRADECQFLVVRNVRVIDCFFGIHLAGVTSSLIEGNEVFGRIDEEEDRKANGIHLWKCSRDTVRNNHVSGHRDGIYFEFVQDSRVDGNTSEDNARYGLHFMFSHHDHYTHNEFRDNGAGVAVMFSHDVEMTDNRFLRNRGASAYGLLLKEINDVTMERNEFRDNTSGLFMDGCNRVVATDNTFISNGWALRMFANTMSTTFQGNSFTGNTFDVTTNGDMAANTVDGNYWDRYRGYDLDRNGTGDVPHRPLSLFASLLERTPYAVILSRSLLVQLLDVVERLLPSVSSVSLVDEHPLMRPPDDGDDSRS